MVGERTLGDTASVSASADETCSGTWPCEAPCRTLLNTHLQFNCLSFLCRGLAASFVRSSLLLSLALFNLSLTGFLLLLLPTYLPTFPCHSVSRRNFPLTLCITQQTYKERKEYKRQDMCGKENPKDFFPFSSSSQRKRFRLRETQKVFYSAREREKAK